MSSVTALHSPLSGVALLSDVLPDLPLPIHHPSLLEATVLGNMGLSEHDRRVLSNSDPTLIATISNALSSVNTDFLKLKVTPPNNGYKCDITSPALIKAIVKSGFSEPKINLKKVDTNLYKSPWSTSNKATTPTKREPHTPIYDVPRRDKRRSSSKGIIPVSLPKDKGVPLEPLPRDKGVSLEALSRDKRKRKRLSLVVSLKRSDVTNDDVAISRRKRRKIMSSSSDSDDQKDNFIVKVSRKKLVPHTDHRSQPIDDNKEAWSAHDSRYQQHTAPQHHHEQHAKRERRKFKNSSQAEGNRAQLQRYKEFCEMLFDQCDAADLLSRHAVSQLLSETIRLKQLSILHKVSIGTLVKLITLMDKHVLDAASLKLTDPPDMSDAKSWREVAKERVLRSLDAGIVFLVIMTTPHMPTDVHLEESVDQLISLAIYHLEYNIYPEYDPMYRHEAKESGASTKQKRRFGTSANKDVTPIYHKMVDVVELLSKHVEMQSLTDTTVLKLSSLGIFPFFVENVSSLQLSCLKLVRIIFARYEKHRDLILEDIFTSLAKLPTTKKNLRSFRVSDEGSIQMVTALILQLVQCMVQPSTDDDGNDSGKVVVDDVALVNSLELAVKTGSVFLSKFMKKCAASNTGEDFRPLFDNFVQDLLSTLHLPEWPASDILLTRLGGLLIQCFNNKTNDLQLRLTSIEQLGLIASSMRKDFVSTSKSDHDELVDILSEVIQRKMDTVSPLPSPTDLNQDVFSDNANHLRKVLIAYLVKRSETDQSCQHARDFYIAQWLRDSQTDIERILKMSAEEPDRTLYDDDNEEGGATSRALYQAEKTKDLIMSFLTSQSDTQFLSAVLDGRRALLVTRYLASCQSLYKSFDMYLKQLLLVLNETAVHVRTKAMKSLSAIVAVDPSLLSRSELQKAVHHRFMDSSTLMREAAVDLIGRFVLMEPRLVSQYYEMLLGRIKDSGISVRRRVIKILKDICISYPKFEKLTDIYGKMIDHINDEEGVKQLVASVFHEVWFAMPSQDHVKVFAKRLEHITTVIAQSPQNEEHFEHLLQQLLKNEDASHLQSIKSVCQVMVDSLMDRILHLDTAENRVPQQLVSCFSTLHIFSKVLPTTVVRHVTTLSPYLSSDCSTQDDIAMVCLVCKTLELVVPLMVHPSHSFLFSLEEDLVKLIMKQRAVIVQNCVSCLSEVVNKVTHNYNLVKQCYMKYYTLLEKAKLILTEDPNNSRLQSSRTNILRAIYIVGLCCKHFDIDYVEQSTSSGTISKESSITESAYNLLMFFCSQSDKEVQIKAITSLGFLCVRYPEMMLKKEAKDFYLSCLTSESQLKMKCVVINNLHNYLLELENNLRKADEDKDTDIEEESLMELGDKHSTVSSSIAQLYLPHVLESFYTLDSDVRLSSLKTVERILHQGLVHPGQCVPHLIAMSNDTDQTIHLKANKQLTEYHSKFGVFMQTHITNGFKKAYEFSKLLSGTAPRGYTEHNISVLGHLYSLVKSSKPQRRTFLKAILRYFEEYKQSQLGMMLYLADNLAAFAYTVLDEPLFIIHHIDITLSTGTKILDDFREAIGSSKLEADDEEEDMDTLLQQPCDMSRLNQCCYSRLSCLLLLSLKQHLKRAYNISFKKCQEYSPTGSNKAWEKSVTHNTHMYYNPSDVVEEVSKELLGKRTTYSKAECLKFYLQFKQVMKSVESVEGDDEPVKPSTSLKTATEFDKKGTPKSRKQRSRSRASSSSSTSSISNGRRKNSDNYD